VRLVTVKDIKDFDAAFGETGFKVGPRTGPNRRTKDEKEWYVVRRFLKEAIRAEIFEVPLSISKGQPPEPDFLIEQKAGITVLEITEATDESDQREMTEIELSDKAAVLLGEFGGRFRGGASEPGYAWSSDIIAAIQRKKGKQIFLEGSSTAHLVIYPNSNGSSLLFDFEDECRAFDMFRAAVDGHNGLADVAKRCFVHILGKETVFIDILGTQRNFRRD